LLGIRYAFWLFAVLSPSVSSCSDRSSTIWRANCQAALLSGVGRCARSVSREGVWWPTTPGRGRRCGRGRGSSSAPPACRRPAAASGYLPATATARHRRADRAQGHGSPCGYLQPIRQKAKARDQQVRRAACRPLFLRGKWPGKGRQFHRLKGETIPVEGAALRFIKRFSAKGGRVTAPLAPRCNATCRRSYPPQGHPTRDS